MTKKYYLLVRITQDSVADLNALSVALFAREELVKCSGIVKIRCLQEQELQDASWIAELIQFKPAFVLVVDGWTGKMDLEVYHQVVPDWVQYKKSYHVAVQSIFHSRRLRKLHNRYVSAGYAYPWLQKILAPTVYVRLGADRVQLEEMMAQGKALALAMMDDTFHDIIKIG